MSMVKFYSNLQKHLIISEMCGKISPEAVIMVQNLKNFLIAFVTGLVVFGICAIFLINYLNSIDVDNVANEPKTEISESEDSSQD